MTAEGGLRKRRSFFVQVPREAVRAGLTWKALGLLTYLLDMPDGWDVRSTSLALVGPDGKESTQSGLKVLRAAGFYRLERRRMLDGTFAMGTAISEEAVPTWATEHKEFGGKAVPMLQQADGTFLVQHKDGTLSPDGFSPEHVDEPPFEDPGATGDGKPGSGESIPTGDGKPDSGSADSGSPGPIRETDEGRSQKVVKGGSHQGLKAVKPLPQNRPNYDEHGRTTPRCDQHVGAADDKPCGACRDARVEYQAASTSRADAGEKFRQAQARADRERAAGDAPKPAGFSWRKEATQ